MDDVVALTGGLNVKDVCGEGDRARSSHKESACPIGRVLQASEIGKSRACRKRARGKD